MAALVVIVTVDTNVPTFHIPAERETLRVPLRARCGQVLDSHCSWLRRNHAEKFGRLCDQCRAAT